MSNFTKTFEQFPEQTKSGKVFIMGTENTTDPKYILVRLGQNRKDLRRSISYALSDPNRGVQVTAFQIFTKEEYWESDNRGGQYMSLKEGEYLEDIPTIKRTMKEINSKELKIHVEDVLGIEVLENLEVGKPTRGINFMEDDEIYFKSGSLKGTSKGEYLQKDGDYIFRRSRIEDVLEKDLIIRSNGKTKDLPVYYQERKKG